MVVFAKAPIPGQVKTRLCPPLTPDEAATLQGSLVLDLAERARALAKSGACTAYAACAPSKDHVFFKILGERQGLDLFDQVGQDLGARMHRAFADAFARGHRRVVLVGTDVPTLTAGALSEALTLLAQYEMVVGPAEDGGYYLIGLTRPVEALFEGIPWSTDQVLARTLERAKALDLRAVQLATRRDIDRPQDLLAYAPLAAAAGQGHRPSGELSVRTADVIHNLAKRLARREAET